MLGVDWQIEKPYYKEKLHWLYLVSNLAPCITLARDALLKDFFFLESICTYILLFDPFICQEALLLIDLFILTGSWCAAAAVRSVHFTLHGHITEITYHKDIGPAYAVTVWFKLVCGWLQFNSRQEWISAATWYRPD